MSNRRWDEWGRRHDDLIFVLLFFMCLGKLDREMDAAMMRYPWRCLEEDEGAERSWRRMKALKRNKRS